MKKFGAKADGKTKVTKVLQKAIDTVSESGGGRVILSGGTFLTGAVELKSGVELFIDADAVFLGSPDLEDYPNREETRHFDGDCVPRWRNIALIYADQAYNIAITGRGKIDCNGDVFVASKKDTNWTWWQYDRIVPYEKSVPRACFFAGCTNIRYVTVTNSIFRSWSSGVRLGWTNDGVIRNCVFSNIVMHDTSNAITCFLPNKKINAHTNDYGREATLVENITFSNIQMKEIYGCPIYVYVGKDTEDAFFAGFRNVTFDNIQCSSLCMPYFNGREDAAVENITFNGCRFEKFHDKDFPLNKRQHGATLGAVLRIPDEPIVNVHDINIVNTTFDVR